MDRTRARYHLSLNVAAVCFMLCSGQKRKHNQKVEDIEMKTNEKKHDPGPLYNRTTPFLCKLADAQNRFVKTIKDAFKGSAADQSKGSDYKGTLLDRNVRFHKSKGQEADLFVPSQSDDWQPYKSFVA